MAHPGGSLPTPSRPHLTFGEVFELSPENFEHTSIGGFLCALLAYFVEQHDLGRVLPGRWLRPEWLLSEPRPKLAEVLRLWDLA